MKNASWLFSALFAVLLLPLCHAAAEPNYTIMVSLDGFRWDYPLQHNTPHLDAIARKGVSATMLPSFPASTYPNHYTLATGLTPDRHGIINNRFWVEEAGKMFAIDDPEMRDNPAFYGGEPIWTTAQKQGLKTATIYWVGSDIPIKGQHPTYYTVYEEESLLTFQERIDTAIQWLQKPDDERPRLIMLYIDQPDGHGHTFGPDTPEVKEMVEHLDSLMGTLIQQIEQLPFADRINLIVTSDHGMTEIDRHTRYIHPDEVLDPATYTRIVTRNPSYIFAEEQHHDTILQAFSNLPHINAYKKDQIPAHLQYGTHPRMGDIVVIPDNGWQFDVEPLEYLGMHGYDPQHPDMQVIFRAFGPDFKENHQAQPFHNTDIYSLLCLLLHITPEPTQGNPERILPLLRQP